MAPGHPVPIPDPAPRRRGRTALLIACAAILGVVAGTVGGYAVQYDRQPTALPPLSQPAMRQPAPLPEGKGPEPLTPAADRLTKTSGDLRKLLLPRPAGAQDVPFGPRNRTWVSLFAYAHNFKEPEGIFENLVDVGFRRAAGSSWEQGDGLLVDIRLVQFRDEASVASMEFLSGQQSYMPTSRYAGNDGKPLAGSGNGRVYVFNGQSLAATPVPLYTARALARRGDIVMDLWLYSVKPIGDSTATSLAKRQLERL